MKKTTIEKTTRSSISGVTKRLACKFRWRVRLTLLMTAGLLGSLLWLTAGDVSPALSHSGPVYQAKKTLVPITVDGALNEAVWNPNVSVTKLVVGSSSNNTVTYDALWDNTYLYVGVKVLDGNLYNDTANAWEDDSVDVYVDANHAGSATYQSDDRQLTKGYNDSGLSGTGSQTGVLHGWAAISGGYSVEMAIPWSNLGVTPGANVTIGFDVGCNDDDNAGTRENQLMWAGTSDNWQNTSAFGDLTLSSTTVGGGGYQAKKTLDAITVDGALNETVWNPNASVTKLVVGSSSNNTVTYDALWDNTYLYVGVKVLDGNLYNDTANAWEDDSVEVYVDANHARSATYQSDDREFAKGYNDSGLVSVGSQTGVLHGWAAISGGYSVEMAIPWSNLGVTPGANVTIGFDVGCNDDDDGGTRENQLMWAGTSDNWQNTSAFGDLTLSSTTVGGGGGCTPPTVTITAPANGAFLRPDALNVAVTANASSGTVGVQFKVDGNNLGAEDTVAPYSVNWDVAYTAVGPHTLTAVARNSGCSATSASVSATVELFAGLNTHAAFGDDSTLVHNLLVEANANGFRDHITWGHMETTAGVYKWSDSFWQNLENLIDLCNADGIRHINIVAYANDLYPNPVGNQNVWRATEPPDDNDPGRIAFGNFGKAMASRLGDRDRITTIWNEFDGGFFGVPTGYNFQDATPARYERMQRFAYPRIKQGNPQAIILGPVTSFVDPYTNNWLQQLKDLGAAQYMDWIDLHTYTHPSNTNPLDVNKHRPEYKARWMISDIQPKFPTKPIIVSEWGNAADWDTDQPSRPKDDVRAEWVARSFFSFRTVPSFRGLFWYELLHRGDNWGFATSATRDKAFYTFQDVAPIIRRAQYLGRAGTASNVWFLRFKDSSGDLYIAWREPEGATTLSFGFNASAAGSLQVRQFKTTSSPPANTTYNFVAGANTISIPLTTMPKLIRVSGGAITPTSPSFP